MYVGGAACGRCGILCIITWCVSISLVLIFIWVVHTRMHGDVLLHLLACDCLLARVRIRFAFTRVIFACM